MSKVLYLIGSLRNPAIPVLADKLRKEHDVEVFDDWFAAGPTADDEWKRYEQGRGRTYEEALEGYAAKHVFDFDRFHLDRATHVLLVLPAGKSGHMEIMYAAYGAKNKPKTAILLDETDVRWDVMYQFVPTILHAADRVSPWLSGVVKQEGVPDGSIIRRSPPMDSRSGQETRLEEQLITRGRPDPVGVPNGGWAAGLLPQRSGGSVTPLKAGWGQASSRRSTPLGT